MVEFAQDRILERNPCNVAFQQSRPCQITAWQAPVQHAYKVNFDVAVFADEGLAGLRVVIRLMGSCSHQAYPKLMKFSVAPESSRAMASALLAID